MANKGKNTNSSQFFITYKAASHLDRKHTIFGRVTSGLNVLTRWRPCPPTAPAARSTKIAIKDVFVLIDPFEEFLTQRREEERREQRREQFDARAAPRTTGRRGRASASGATAPSREPRRRRALGSILTQRRRWLVALTIRLLMPVGKTWTRGGAVKKKFKSGGFGNFDSW